MQTQHDNKKHGTSGSQEATSFFDKPRNVNIILNSFYIICALLVVFDFIVQRHIYVSFEEIPAFYAIYGFIACVVLVVLAKLMRLVLMRKETYYDDRLDETAHANEDSFVAHSSAAHDNKDDVDLRTGDKQ